MAGRVDLAKEDFANGAPAFLAGIPGLQNRGQMFGFPRQGHGGAAAIDHDHGLPVAERLHKSLLHFGQFNRIRSNLRLPAPRVMPPTYMIKPGGIPPHENDDFRDFGRGNRRS